MNTEFSSDQALVATACLRETRRLLRLGRLAEAARLAVLVGGKVLVADRQSAVVIDNYGSCQLIRSHKPLVV